MDRQTIASYNRSWSVVGSRHVVKNRARGVLCWLLQNATAGKESRMKGGGDKTKLHELIVGEHLSKQWGEPQEACACGDSMRVQLPERMQNLCGVTEQCFESCGLPRK